MNGHDLVEGLAILKGALDNAKTFRGIMARHASDPGLQPVYRLVSRPRALEPTEVLPPRRVIEG
jgi:hypothetical protein